MPLEQCFKNGCRLCPPAVSKQDPYLAQFRAMPGEERIRTSELHYFHRDVKKLVQLEPKWKDESYQNVEWDEPTNQLRFLRRDRLLRNVEFCSLDTKTGKVTTMFAEGAKDVTEAVGILARR